MGTKLMIDIENIGAHSTNVTTGSCPASVILQTCHVQKSFDHQTVLKDINITLHEGEFVAIIGKSGCGKSTLLRLIAGLDTVTDGDIQLCQQRVDGISQDARILFQNGRFLPWQTIINNVGIGLRGNWRAEAAEYLKMVGLEGFEDRYPKTLSGGQKQRVALARALMHRPKLLLLDEPLSALDALTRIEMQDLIEKVAHQHQLTCMLVTHDVEEATRLADRVILLADGVIKNDVTIRLPHPRKRSSAAFNQYTESLLNAIMH